MYYQIMLVLGMLFFDLSIDARGKKNYFTYLWEWGSLREFVYGWQEKSIHSCSKTINNIIQTSAGQSKIINAVLKTIRNRYGLSTLTSMMNDETRHQPIYITCLNDLKEKNAIIKANPQAIFIDDQPELASIVRKVMIKK